MALRIHSICRSLCQSIRHGRGIWAALSCAAAASVPAALLLPVHAVAAALPTPAHPLSLPARAWKAEARLVRQHNLAAAPLLSLSPAPANAPAAASPPSPTTAPGLRWGPGTSGQRSSDAHFIVMMIPHHQGAIAMSELALKRAKRPELKALAQRIITSQSREIAQMRQWYRQWYGTEVPTWTLAPGMGMGMGMGMGPGMGRGPGPGMGGGGPMGGGGQMTRGGWGMPGMATSLEALKSAADFDRAFIEQMIPHHRMGVMMASHARWSSQHPELRELEAAMVRVQSQEIEQMAQWYRQWFAA